MILENTKDKLERLIKIGIALSSEKDSYRLLEMIVTEARLLMNADAGTLFLLDGEMLHFQIIQNDTLKIYQGGDRQPVHLPPVPLDRKSVSGIAALDRMTINIPDVYKEERYNVEGPLRYDSLTGYRTQSMLVIPLENSKQEGIGVMQLLNARDEKGTFIPFSPYLEPLACCLASQVGVALSNMQYLEEIERALFSFVEVLSTGIDALSPYNASHSKNIAKLAESFALYLHGLKEGPYASLDFDKARVEQLVMAAWLHDVGKVVIPKLILDKQSRLGERLEEILLRFKVLRLQTRLDAYEKNVKGDDALKALDEAESLIVQANDPFFRLDEKTAETIASYGEKVLLDEEGTPIRWLTEEEVYALTNARGTLTKKERIIMESHVEITERMLSKMAFGKKYKDVPLFASLHHEYLDGTGYPKGLTEKEIPLEARILTLLDVFEALTADDRPYKKPHTTKRAFDILGSMVDEGKLDGNLLTAFYESKVWC